DAVRIGADEIDIVAGEFAQPFAVIVRRFGMIVVEPGHDRDLRLASADKFETIEHFGIARRADMMQTRHAAPVEFHARDIARRDDAVPPRARYADRLELLDNDGRRARRI